MIKISFDDKKRNEIELWYDEKLELDRGTTIKIKIEDTLYSSKSKFQRIDVFKTKPFGKMLVIDGIIMLTESDEFCYHEMISHVGLCVHPGPKDVLIIGGGDGGTLREVLKHKDVESVELCEIDEEVIKVSKEFFPNLASSFSDKRVKIRKEDGSEFVKKNKSKYDMIIVDSTDPIGPARNLFTEKFYKNLYTSLKKDGIAITQAESFFYHLDFIKKMISFIRKTFTVFLYYYTLVPTYPSGMIGFTFCSKRYHPLEDFKPEKVDGLKGLKYYNKGIHISSFSLPEFANKIFKK